MRLALELLGVRADLLARDTALGARFALVALELAPVLARRGASPSHARRRGERVRREHNFGHGAACARESHEGERQTIAHRSTASFFTSSWLRKHDPPVRHSVPQLLSTRNAPRSGLFPMMSIM